MVSTTVGRRREAVQEATRRSGISFVSFENASFSSRHHRISLSNSFILNPSESAIHGFLRLPLRFLRNHKGNRIGHPWPSRVLQHLPLLLDMHGWKSRKLR